MKNKYEIRGDIVAIFIKSPKYGEFEALVSVNNLDKLKDHPGAWGVKKGSNENLYVATHKPNGNRKSSPTEFLHRFLTNAPKGMEVDHIDHDTLNNMDSNLRLATVSENQQNRNGATKNSKSGIRGVMWHKGTGKWSTQIRINGRKVSFGYYHDLKQAEQAVLEGRRAHMPFAN